MKRRKGGDGLTELRKKLKERKEEEERLRRELTPEQVLEQFRLHGIGVGELRPLKVYPSGTFYPI